jgi:hypothetical protein
MKEKRNKKRTPEKQSMAEERRRTHGGDATPWGHNRTTEQWWLHLENGRFGLRGEGAADLG